MDLERTVPLKPDAPAPKPAAAPKPDGARKEAPFKPETAADAWLGLLAARGIEYLFANGGTDLAPGVQAHAKGEEVGWRLPPDVVVAPQEKGVALAHGHALGTRPPPAMMGHVGAGDA